MGKLLRPNDLEKRYRAKPGPIKRPKPVTDFKDIGYISNDPDPSIMELQRRLNETAVGMAAAGLNSFTMGPPFEGCTCAMCKANGSSYGPPPVPRPGPRAEPFQPTPMNQSNTNEAEIQVLRAEVRILRENQKRMQDSLDQMLKMVELIASDLEVDLGIANANDLSPEKVATLAEASVEMRARRIGAEREVTELDKECDALAAAHDEAVTDLSYWRDMARKKEEASGSAA